MTERQRFFKEVRKGLVNRVFGSLSEAYDAVEGVVNQLNQQADRVVQLTLSLTFEIRKPYLELV